MSSKLRLALPIACIGVVGVACFLLLQSHASARVHMNYARLNETQKRIISDTLAGELGPQPATAARAHIEGPISTGGSGVDGAPFTPPGSFGPPVRAGSAANYFPSSSGNCSADLRGNVKVNQNCLNLSDPDLQGRGQANNEPSIAVDPFDPWHLVASDTSYVRGDEGCGSYFSLDGGRTWTNTTIPDGFTNGPAGVAREYWQAGGDTSVAWDTRGNAYVSCQLFNRGSGSSPNVDQSSAFAIFRATQNHGASWNLPGRYTTVAFDPTDTAGALEDKAAMTIDDNVHSPYRDRIYVTWTEFAADGTAYIWEVHSDDYGETFSNRVLVSASSPTCTNAMGWPTPKGTCNENQASDPFVGKDGSLYVAWDNFNNQPTSGNNNNYQVLLAKSTDGGQSFSSPVQVSPYYDLPDCDTYQGPGANPGHSCIPEKGSSTLSVFRAANYPSGAVDPNNPDVVAVTFGSYINKDSNENNGCVPMGVASDENPLYAGVKTPGACANKILLSVSRNGGTTFSGAGADPRTEELVTQSRGQTSTDQFWESAAFTNYGRLAVEYYDRQYGDDETTGSSDVSLSGSDDLTHFGQARVTSSSMPAPTQFGGQAGGQLYGDYTGLAASEKAYPIWSDTRALELFLCPGSGTPDNPPAVCKATEPNGEVANDEETFMAAVGVPTANYRWHWSRVVRHRSARRHGARRAGRG
jgi:hypothetical protein